MLNLNEGFRFFILFIIDMLSYIFQSLFLFHRCLVCLNDTAERESM